MKTTSKLNRDLLKEYCLYLIELILSAYDPKTHGKEIVLYRDSSRDLIEKLHSANHIAGLKSVRNGLGTRD